MEYKKNYYKYLIRLDSGEEIAASLKEFCLREKVGLGSITGVGLVNNATIILPSFDNQNTQEQKLNGNFELVPLSGNISLRQNQPDLQLQAKLVNTESKIFNGLLLKATASSVCQIIIDTIESEIGD